MDEHDSNPQARQMGDESMARNLAHQARAIWPQEQPLFARYGLYGDPCVLDLGCGTGEITRRLAELFPQAQLLGVDILEGNIEQARASTPESRKRVRYARGDAYALDLPSRQFDLVVCRHVSQSIPDFPRALAEIARVLRPGGWLHWLAEDYGMLHMPVGEFDPDDFWHDIVFEYFRRTHCDSRSGRHAWAQVRAMGFTEIAVDYAVVDPLRADRADFAGIMRAWRDGYVDALAEATGRDVGEVRRRFDAIVACVENQEQYAVWHVPIIGARKPA
jgi:ubiquinone/menaquinone biosynthesis C-methylase UbiE